MIVAVGAMFIVAGLEELIRRCFERTTEKHATTTSDKSWNNPVFDAKPEQDETRVMKKEMYRMNVNINDLKIMMGNIEKKILR